MPTQTILDKIVPPFTPRAMGILKAHRASNPESDRTVRIAAVEIARHYNSAWVIACHVRAAIAGKSGKDVGMFDLNSYVDPTDLAAKPKVKK